MTLLRKSTPPALRVGLQVLAFGVAASFVALFAMEPHLTGANASEAYAPEIVAAAGSAQSFAVTGTGAASVQRDNYTITDPPPPPPPPAPEPVAQPVAKSPSSGGGGGAAAGCSANVVPTPGEPDPSSYQGIAWTALQGYGFGIQEYYYLLALWNKESGWNPLAHNASSGAHGIPQALPGSKMGPGWESDPNVQIDWGLRYIMGVYGSPCEAWASSVNRGWY